MANATDRTRTARNPAGGSERVVRGAVPPVMKTPGGPTVNTPRGPPPQNSRKTSLNPRFQRNVKTDESSQVRRLPQNARLEAWPVATDTVTELREEHVELASFLDSIEKQAKSRDQLVKQVETQIAELSAELESKNHTLESLQSQMAKVEVSGHSNETRSKYLANKVEKLQKTVRDRDAEIEDMQESISGRESELSSGDTHNSEEKKGKSVFQEQLQNALKRARESDTKARDLETKLKEVEGREQGILQKMKAKTDQLAVMKRRVETAEKKLHDIVQSNKEAKESIATAKGGKNTVPKEENRASAPKTKEQPASMKKELNEVSTKLQDALGELETTRGALVLAQEAGENDKKAAEEMRQRKDEIEKELTTLENGDTAVGELTKKMRMARQAREEQEERHAKEAAAQEKKFQEAMKNLEESERKALLLQEMVRATQKDMKLRDSQLAWFKKKQQQQGK